jgi:hypothetical protein
LHDLFVDLSDISGLQSYGSSLCVCHWVFCHAFGLLVRHLLTLDTLLLRAGRCRLSNSVVAEGGNADPEKNRSH